jgi:hypothetical protein
MLHVRTGRLVGHIVPQRGGKTARWIAANIAELPELLQTTK